MEDRSSFLVDQLLLIGMGFLIPGLVPLFALATTTPTVASWFGGASLAPTMAGFFLVALGAVALGFIITAIRFSIYERSILGLPCLVKAPNETLDLSKRRDFADDYRDLRQSHYYHYLAHANLSVAVPLSIVIWAGGAWASNQFSVIAFVVITTLGIIVTAALGRSACEAIRRYEHKRGQLLGFKTPPAA